MTTAIYMRVSSELQAERNGTAAQRDTLRQWCAAHGVDYDSCPIYEDLAKSGKNMARPEFRRLTGDAEAGKVKTIVAYDLSRIGRSLVDLLVWTARMNELGVRVVFARNSMDIEGPMGRLILSIMGAVAEFQRTIDQERRTDGIRAFIARNGTWAGGLSKGGNGRARLTREQWSEIVTRRDAGERPADLAAEFGVSVHTVRKKGRGKCCGKSARKACNPPNSV